ncbi:MAG: amidohydrolase family protein [Pseudomonadota bacterium]
MAANTGQSPPDDRWLDTLQEEILEPELAIIDPHHHLWLRNGYRYLLPEFAEDLACGHNIVATVFAECHSMYRAGGLEETRAIGETEFVRGQAAMSASGEFGSTRACEVMFGNVDLTLGSAVEPILTQHQEAAGGRFRGVRISSGWHDSDQIPNVATRPQLLVDPQVGQAAAVLQRLGMSLDCWLYHTQLDEVVQFAETYPDLTIVLNHVGSPILGGPYRGQADTVFREWKLAINRVSACDNVFVKLGALPIRMPTYSGDRTLPPGSEEVAAAWRPWMEACIEAFSPARAMYESNFPVQKRWCSYQVCWNAFKRISAGASDMEKVDLFFGAAAQAYRLDGDLCRRG